MSPPDASSLAETPAPGGTVAATDEGYSYHPVSLLRSALAGGAFLGFGIGGWLLSILVLPLVYRWPGTRLERRRRCQRVVGFTFRFFHAYMRVTGLIDYRPIRRVPLGAPPSVWIANHPSLVDVTAVIAAHPELCCVVKSSVYKNPLFYSLMLACGHIPVDRNDPASGARVLELAAERLAEGHSVLVFPEGTRSPAWGVNDFHPGAFAMAVSAGAPIQPVLLVADTPFLKRGTPWYKVPRSLANLSIEALPPLDTAALVSTGRGVTSRALCRRTQQLFEKRLHEAHVDLTASRSNHERAGT
jgi:1-acyl-sn-glycerol-3-phosphate acyltransferase